jgi:hypothetical protein
MILIKLALLFLILLHSAIIVRKIKLWRKSDKEYAHA